MSQRPNVLFLFTDQHRPDFLGTDPDVPVRTPNVDALAAEGVQFTNAVCPSPLCAPSRASLVSGYEYDRCGVLSNYMEYPHGQPTYQRRLREAGYHVMGCGKFHVGHGSFTEPRNFSWDLSGTSLLDLWGFSEGVFNEGKVQSAYLADHSDCQPRGAYTAYLDEVGWLREHVEDYRRRCNATGKLPRMPGLESDTFWTATFPTPLPDEAYFDTWIAENGLDLLEDAPRDQPWYLEVNFQNPHHPWDVTEEMHGWYRDPPVEFPGPVESDLEDLDVPPETHQEVRRNYAAMVEHLDRQVGRFLEKLDERGEREETLVVFTSDHGEMLGDHGQWQKMSPLQMSVGVPLVVAGPSVRDRDPTPEPTTILDLHATFLDYAGLTPPAGIDSRSLRPFLDGDGDPPRDVVYSGLGPWRLVFDGRYKLIEGYDPREYAGPHSEAWELTRTETERLREERETILHDLEKSERENVADAHPDLVADLQGRLDAISRDTDA